MVANMIVCPYNYDGPSYPVVILKHDLGEFFSNYPNDRYQAYDNHEQGVFVCEMDPQLELVFVLKYPKYRNYQRG